jgi:CRISPR-associated protein Csh1
MIRALREIGRYSKTKWNKNNKDILSKKLSTKKKENNKEFSRKVYCINIGDENANYCIEDENYDEGNYAQYLFRTISSNSGTNFSPTITYNNDLKKLLNYFLLEEKKKRKIFRYCGEENEIAKLEKIISLFELRKNDLVNDISKYNPKKGFDLVSLKIDGKYLSENKLFTTLFINFVENSLKEIYSENKKCSICTNDKHVVYGDISTYSFYTLDKPGFISGGFNKNEAWKNYPICLDCFYEIEEGKNFVEQKLNFRFMDLKFLIVPSIIFSEKDGNKIDLELETILNILKEQDNSIKSNNIRNYKANEKEIIRKLSKAPNSINFSLLFLVRENAAERIKLIIDEIPPSRLSKISDSIQKTENIFSKKYSFSKVREFFSNTIEKKQGNKAKVDSNEKKEKNKRNFDKYFYSIIESIFKLKLVNIDFICDFFLFRLRKLSLEPVANSDTQINKQEKEQEFFKSARNAFMNIVFFQNLNLLELKGGYEMEENLFKEYFAQFGENIKIAEKKALYLLGALTQRLLIIQKKKRGGQPFKKKLKNYKMDKEDFIQLITQIKEKLDNYDSFYIKESLIIGEISNYFNSPEASWNISLSQMNCYFIFGMSNYTAIYKILNDYVELTKGEKNEEVRNPISL